MYLVHILNSIGLNQIKVGYQHQFDILRTELLYK